MSAAYLQVLPVCAGVAGQAGVEAPVPGHPGQLLPPQLGVAEQCGALIDVLTAPLQSAAWKKTPCVNWIFDGRSFDEM